MSKITDRDREILGQMSPATYQTAAEIAAGLNNRISNIVPYLRNMQRKGLVRQRKVYGSSSKWRKVGGT